MIARLLALALAADGGSGLVDAKGAEWTVRDDARQPEGGGMAERRKHHVLRNGVEVAVVEDSAFVQSNPTMYGATTWSFGVRGGQFEATGRSESSQPDQKKKQTSIQVLRWDGKALSPAK